MNVQDPELKKWAIQNRETLIGQLVLYHSPVSLAEMVLDDEKIDDAAVRLIKRRLEKSEGLLKKEKSKRKKDFKGKEVGDKPTEREKDDSVKEEKSKETEEACKEKAETKFSDVFVGDDFELDDDDQDQVFSQF